MSINVYSSTHREEVESVSKHTETPLEIDEMSNRRENMLSNQLANAVKNSGIVQIGTSRHDAKQERYSDLAEKGQKADSHNVNATIGITSYSSLHKFQGNIGMFGKWCFGNCDLNNINQIKPAHVTDFLRAMCDCEYAKNTVQSYASSLEKMAVMLDNVCPTSTPRAETWHAAIAEVRPEINDLAAKDTETRAYADPRGLIDALDNPQMQMIASLQLDHGLRIGDATRIDTANIDGTTLTICNSKGGQDITITLTPEEVGKINALADNDGLLHVRQSDYSAALRDACELSGQTWTGSHGLRHNYAQERMATLTAQGMDYNTALRTVSEEMGHHRIDITLTYLR